MPFGVRSPSRPSRSRFRYRSDRIRNTLGCALDSHWDPVLLLSQALFGASVRFTLGRFGLASHSLRIAFGRPSECVLEPLGQSPDTVRTGFGAPWAVCWRCFFVSVRLRTAFGRPLDLCSVRFGQIRTRFTLSSDSIWTPFGVR